MLIDATGGAYGVRDVGLLESIVARPKMKVFGNEIHKDVFTKSAIYLESIVRYHVFVDGNKRASITVAVRFLYINGYEFMATNKEVEKFVLKVVVQKPEINHITEWLKKHY